jgi:hypothetical protein
VRKESKAMSTSISTYLRKGEDELLEKWVVATKQSGISYPQIISEDILIHGAAVYKQLVGILGRPSYQLGTRKRINPTGRQIGRKRAMAGVSLEAVMELFVLFRHELWDAIGEFVRKNTIAQDELLEYRRRIDLYLDQFIASIAYSYTRTKEEAMVGLIEKLLS